MIKRERYQLTLIFNMDIHYSCIKCNKQYTFAPNNLTCTEHSKYYGYLNVVYDYTKTVINYKAANPYYKYKNLLPLNNFDIKFGLTKTPLFPLKQFAKKYGFKNVFVKDESRNPTGSFKDRENFCAIQKAVDWKIDKVFTVSSGNAAISTAAFAQKACIQCDCIVTKSLSVGKRFLIQLYGGNLIEKNMTYEEMYRWATDSNYNGWNCTPGINPIKEEGIKLIGYEIWEDIGVPDIIVVPCGNGTLLWSIYKSFYELQLLGLIEKLPVFIGVQVKDSAPLKNAFETHKDYIELPTAQDSIAEGIIAQESYSSPKVMIALNNSQGFIVEVTENEIKESLLEIIELESLIPEPTSAVVYAAIKQLKHYDDKKIVVIQTGGGFKNLKEIMEIKLLDNYEKN